MTKIAPKPAKPAAEWKCRNFSRCGGKTPHRVADDESKRRAPKFTRVKLCEECWTAHTKRRMAKNMERFLRKRAEKIQRENARRARYNETRREKRVA